jgi:C-terminal processing protease CtpA/Prc
MLAELKDVHVYYRRAFIFRNQRYPYKSPRQIKDKNAISKSVIRKHFNKRLKSSKGVLYGITPASIGYICFKSFHNSSLIDELPDIFKYLSNTKGLIVDLRSPRGGDYNVVLAFVNYFITTSMAKPELYILEKIDQPPFQPSESEYTYIKPVVVLINGITISAGELTTQILKQLPNVTVIGDTTCGGGGASSGHILKAVGEYKLQNGVTIMVPTGYFKCYDGTHIEWNGVSPDIRIEQTESDINNGKDKQLEYAINYLNKSNI